MARSDASALANRAAISVTRSPLPLDDAGLEVERGAAPSIELFVGHGNVTRYFLCRALQIPPEAWLRFSLPHCSVTSITISGRGRVSVQQVGGVGHLPPRLQSVHNVA